MAINGIVDGKANIIAFRREQVIQFRIQLFLGTILFIEIGTIKQSKKQLVKLLLSDDTETNFSCTEFMLSEMIY